VRNRRISQSPFEIVLTQGAQSTVDNINYSQYLVDLSFVKAFYKKNTKNFLAGRAKNNIS
jgi:hypothetical protein